MTLCETIMDKECTARLNGIPLSDNRIRRRIQDVADDIKVQLIKSLKQRKFAY